MEFRVLGPPELGQKVSGKQQALFVGLLLRRGDSVPRDDLIEDLWGLASPPTAVNALHVHVRRLRHAFATAGLETSIVTTADGYAIAIDDRDWVDFESFERLAAVARAAAAAGDQAEAAAAARRALALWRGEAAAGVVLEGRARKKLDRLEALRLDLLALRVDADIVCGRHDELIPELSALIEANPLEERFRRQLMLALYRSGRQADALNAYRDAQRTLADTLGLDPSPQLRWLERAILAQDAALDLPGPAAVPHAERRIVTVVFIDLDVDRRDVDPEQEAEVRRRWLTVARRTFEQVGATLADLPTGDACAVFGVPSARENDARVAAEASLHACRRLGAYCERVERRGGVRVEFSMGIASGESIFGLGGAHPTRTTRAAAALARLAPPRTILITPTTTALLGCDAVVERLATWNGEPVLRLVDTVSRPTRGLGPFVGRERELETLLDVVERGVAGPRAAITLLGPPGIGKSRLVEACLGRVQSARALHVYCEQPDHGPALQPLRGALEEMFGRSLTHAALAELLDVGADASRAADALLTGAAGVERPPAETAWAVTSLLEALAVRGLVLVLDDLQRAKPQLLDVLATALHRHTAARIALVCVVRAGTAGAGAALQFARSFRGNELELRGLPADAAARMLDEGALGDGTATRARVLATAEGNPLVIEQLARHLADRNGRTGSRLPATLRTLSSVQLDGLPGPEQAFLGRAAAVGRDFTLPLLASLSQSSENDVAHIAETLVDRGLLERTASGYRFRHALVREATYDATPKRTRAAVHEAVAEWLTVHEGTDAAALHLAEAAGLRCDLGLLDRKTESLTARGASLLASGTHAANGRGRVAEALDLLRGAVELVGAADSTVAEHPHVAGP